MKKSQKRLRGPVQAVYTFTRVHDRVHRRVRAKLTACAGRVRDTHGRQRGKKTDFGTDNTGNDIGTARLTQKNPATVNGRDFRRKAVPTPDEATPGLQKSLLVLELLTVLATPKWHHKTSFNVQSESVTPPTQYHAQ